MHARHVRMATMPGTRLLVSRELDRRRAPRRRAERQPYVSRRGRRQRARNSRPARRCDDGDDQPRRCQMAEFPAPEEGITLTHFIVSDDVERSRRFYTHVLGGETVYAGEPSFVALANSWIIINVGGGPTDDKPSVTLETPPDPDRVSSFL